MKKNACPKTIYIHIGPQKTGTTTLQKFFKQLCETNRESVLYPETGRFLKGESFFIQGEYRGVVRYSGPIENHAAIFWTLNGQMCDEDSHSLLEKLSQEISSFPGKVVVLSYEVFGDMSELQIAHLYKALEGNDIRIVLYIREQSRKMLSTYTQHIKSGRTKDNLIEYSENNYHRICNETAVMKKWSRGLPNRENALILKNFDNIVKTTSLEADFINTICSESLNYEYDTSSIIHLNAKLPNYIYRFLLAVNSLEYSIGRPKRLRGAFHKVRDLAIKSSRVQRFVSLFSPFLDKPLVSKQEIIQLEKIVERKLRSLPSVEQSYYSLDNSL